MRDCREQKHALELERSSVAQIESEELCAMVQADCKQHVDGNYCSANSRVPIGNLFSVRLDHGVGENTKLPEFYSTGDTGGTNESNNYVAIGK